MYKAIILDMDGTLVNTERLWKQAEGKLLAAHGRAYDTVIHAEFLGLSVEDFIPALQKAYDLTHISSEILGDQLELFVQDLLETKTQPQEGALELVQYISQKSIPCAIASNSSHEIIRVTLKNQRWADGIQKRYSADDVARAKPSPDLYLHVAQELHVDPSNCIAVEDSLNGVRAAVAAGMTCLAVPDYELVDVALYQALTPYVYDTLQNVLSFIQDNF